jgi:hypothetical protein
MNNERINNIAINEMVTAAARLIDLAPWKRFTADCFLSICDENDNEYFISFANGIHCLPGADALRSYLRYLQNPEDADIALRLRSLALIIKGKELEFASFEPGFVPWELSEYEMFVLTAAYKRATELLEWVNEVNPAVDFSRFESPIRRWDAETSQWVNEVHQLVLPPVATIVIEPPDEFTRYRIAAKQRIDAMIELDVFMLSRPTTEEGFDKPFYPTMIVLADRPNNITLDVRLLPPGRNIPAETIETLTDFVDRHGRPAAIYLQTPEVMAMLRGFCDDVNLPLELMAFLPAVNFYKHQKGLE